MEGLTADEVIKRLGLVPLAGEGGYYRETFRSERGSSVTGRAAATSIYYLLTPETYSALHRLRFDEVYFFHAGDPIEMFLWEADGAERRVVLSGRLVGDEKCQVLVPAGTWQGSRLVAGGKWGLVSTVVAPGFEFCDCELADRALVADWPVKERERALSFLAK